MNESANIKAGLSEPQIDVAVLCVTSADEQHIRAPEDQYLLKALGEVCTRTLLVVPQAQIDAYGREPGYAEFADEIIGASGTTGRLNFYAQSAEHVGKDVTGDVLLCDVSLIGPMQSLTSLIQARNESGHDMMSAFSSHPMLARSGGGGNGLELVCESSWLQISPELWATGLVQSILAQHKNSAIGAGLPKAEAALAKALGEPSDRWSFGCFSSRFETISQQPHLLESGALIEQGHPFLHRSFLLLDPLVFEMETLDGRRTLDAIAEYTDYDVDMVWDVILRSNSLRDIEAKFEELTIIDHDEIKRKSEKLTSRAAMVCHVYYSEFIHEVLKHFRLMPANSTLLVSVASEDGAKYVENAIKAKKVANYKIKVVEKNQGRDMSSLFITFREEFLGEDIDVALRLHSKKSPQVAPHISNSFREHLLENLIKNRAFVQRIVRLFEQNPKIGLVLPPTIHIGFGTLGHSWFTNRIGVSKTAERLGLKVKLDDHTPVAPYGTMFWFRPKALLPMFAERWRWDEFNPEPNHVDGGLAHIMERLIGYVAQSEGFRVLHVANRRQAERNYVKLQFKLQRLSAAFPSADIRQQVKIADSAFKPVVPFTQSLWHRWRTARTKIKRNHPSLWNAIKPFLRVGRAAFIEAPRFLRLQFKRLLRT